MGFRSTLVSQDIGVGVIPDWFKAKYDDRLLFPNGLMIVSKMEAKYYCNTMFEDYRKVLLEFDYFDNHTYPVSILVLGESGSITNVLVSKFKVVFNIITEFGDYEADAPYCI